MNKDEIILMLRQLVASLQQQLADSNRKVDALMREVAELKELLVRKTEEEQKQRNIAKGLSKIMQNKSERQTPAKAAPAADASAGGDGQAAPEAKPREKTNYGAKRLDHCVTEVEHVSVDPDDPRFDKERARWISERESARYILIPMRFIKRIYHVNKYVQDGTVMEGKAPDAPFQGSNYDGSFIAGIAQLRYLYSMPVERIVNFFTENGFDLKKGTAHGLLRKTELLFENLYKAMGLAVKEDDYVAGDETYHKVLVAEKNKDGKGIKKGYIWSVVAVHLGLVYYFYHNGSRSEDVIFDYIDGYGDAFQSDAFSPYRKLARRLTRLACLQHVKRKWLDCEDDFDAKVIVRLLNYLYHKDHRHRIGIDGWTLEDNTRWRQEYAPPILRIIRKKLDRMAAYPPEKMLPKSEKYTAVHYMLNEWEAIENIFTRGDYHLDNNLVERLNRYISLSRRNSLFFGSHKGAERGAMFYSLACSCRLQGISFFEYISDVINKAATLPPNTPLARYRELLPDRWKQARELR
jgi:hypothetical protein